jgi:hypothetical protein
LPVQLEQMLAPVALYPDALLGDILMAATYPLEVVQADHWLQDPGNAALTGDALVAALAQTPWDASVKALVSLPQVLQMMDGNLDWTEEVGDAFVADQTGVMDAVQRLRQRAQAAGNLQPTPQEAITWDGGDATISPSSPDVMDIPIYDPEVAYGPWPYPGLTPDVLPDYFGGIAVGAVGLGWVGVPMVTPLWGWHRVDWRRHRINIDAGRVARFDNHPPPGGAWQHDPAHRHGVPYTRSVARVRRDPTEQVQSAAPPVSPPVAAAASPPSQTLVPVFVPEGYRPEVPTPRGYSQAAAAPTPRVAPQIVSPENSHPAAPLSRLPAPTERRTQPSPKAPAKSTALPAPPPAR